MANEEVMGFRDRVRVAWDVLTHSSDRVRNGIHSARKQVPYRWSEPRIERPQWSSIDYASYVAEGYNHNSLIFSAIMYKVRSGIIAPVRAYEGDVEHPKRVDQAHPLAMLAKRPNKYMSGVDMQKLNDVYLNVAGEVFIFLDRKSERALPNGMYPLRPDRVFPIPKKGSGAQAELLGYIYAPDGVSVGDLSNCIPILPQDMIHIKLPAADDPLEGLGHGASPMRPSGQSIDVDNAVTSFLKLFFKKGTMVHTYLKFDVPLDADGVANARKRFMEIYGGYENWLGPAVTDQGGEVKTFGMTFKEMGFGEIDERNETRIVGPFGVPLILVGSRIGLMRSTYANYKEARLAYWEDTRLPELIDFEESYQYFLQSDDGAFVAFDLTKVPALRKDMPSLVSAFTALVSHGVPKHTAAETVGIDIGTLPDGDVVYMPLNLIPTQVDSSGSDVGGDALDTLDESSEELLPPVASSDSSSDGELDDSADATQDTRKSKRLKALKGSGDQPRDESGRLSETDGGDGDGEDLVSTVKGMSAQQKSTHWKAVDRISRSWERAFALGAKKALSEDRKQIMTLISSAKSRALTRKASIDWNESLSEVSEYLTTGGEQWREIFVPLMQGVITDQGQRWAAELGMQFDVRNFFAEEWFDAYTLQFASPINTTTLDAMNAMFAQAQAEGWSVDTMQNHMTQLFEQWMDGDLTAEEFEWYSERLPGFRTEMIARSESMRASNAGTTELFDAWGVEEREWLSTRDDRVRDSHLEADGQVRGIHEPFEVGGEELMFPLDPNGSPDNTINCRCTTLPIVK